VRGIRTPDFLTINIYWLGLNVASGSLTPIILPFLVERFAPVQLIGLISMDKNTAYGLLRSAGLIVAILVQPLAGLMSDRSTSRWGRRRPFIITGTMLDLVFLFLIGLSGNYGMLFLALLLLQFSSNIAHGALQGLIPDLVPEEQRGRASGVKSIMELLPTILLPLLGIGILVDRGLIWLALAVVMASLFLTMLLTLPVKEGPWPGRGDRPLRPLVGRVVLLTLVFVVATTLFGGLVGMAGTLLRGRGVVQLVAVGVTGLVAIAGAIIVGVWLSARVGIGGGSQEQTSFVWWVTNRLLFLAAVGSIQGFALYFLRDVLRLPNPAQATAYLLAVVGVFLLASAFGSGFLADRFGRKRLLALAGVIAAGGTFLLFLSTDMNGVLVSGCLIGIGTGLFWTTNWALGTELVPKAEAGRYLGISNLAGAGAGVVGAGIGGPLADFFNTYRPGFGYLVVFAIYGVCLLLSSMTLFKVQEPRETTLAVAR